MSAYSQTIIFLSVLCVDIILKKKKIIARVYMANECFFSVFSFRFVLVLFEYYMFVAASYSLLTSVIFAHDFVIISVPKINTMELHRANIKCKEMKRRNRHTTENQKTHRVGRICVEKCRLGVFFRLKYIYATTVQQEHNFAKFMHSQNGYSVQLYCY